MSRPVGPGQLSLLLLLTACSAPTHGITDNGQVKEVVGVAGRRVDMPCDTFTTEPGDYAVLVLWFRDNEGTPTYSFDARDDRSLSDGTTGESRATFVSHGRSSALRLATVRPEDQALYRCRVDFNSSPTRNQRVRLTVVIPPGQPVFVFRKRPVSGTIGPLAEGEPLVVRCVSEGGRPPPRVTWFRDERLLDDTDDLSASGQVTNELRLPALRREDLHSRLVCSAVNNNISLPAVSEVVIDMHFKPLAVEILGSSRTSMLVGKTYGLVCRTFGSRPPANISWWIEDRRILGGRLSESGQGNITSSTLPFKPLSSDNNKEITCRAENGHVSSGTIEDRRMLNVRFAPVVSLRLGQALNPEDIREGVDVYFECSIRANPSIYSVVWSHNGVPVRPSPRAGVGDMISINDRSLVIRNLTRHSSGNYVCRAANPEGESVSRPVHLGVKNAPVCVSGQKTRYGTARNEPASVTCEVDASPADVIFKWQFNSSTETLDLPFSQIESHGLQSRASYTPKTELDYGTLLCTASNRIGRMVQPCVFSIVAAGPPEPLRNCTVMNQTSESLEVACSAGFDGGLPQQFVAELFDAAGRRLVRNLSRPLPAFSVTALPAGLELRLELYSTNSRGRSRPITLDGFTLKTAEKRVSSSRGQAAGPPSSAEQGFTVTPILGVLIGVIASLIIVAIGVVACIRGSSRNLNKPPGQTDLVNSSLLIKQRTGANPGQGRSEVSGKPYDAEHNPDVVPERHDSGYELASTTHLLNHLNVTASRRSSPTLGLRPDSPLNSNTGREGVAFAELTLPRSGRSGKVLRTEESDPVATFATFNPRRAGGPTVVRTVTSGDQESVV